MDDVGMKQVEEADCRAEMNEREGRGLAGGSRWLCVGELLSNQLGKILKQVRGLKRKLPLKWIQQSANVTAVGADPKTAQI